MPNEATAADLEPFHEDGTAVKFCFTPQGGKTYLAECDFYRPLDPGNRAMCTQLPDDARIATYTLTLDLSAYLNSGYSIEGPRCAYESDKTNGKPRRAKAPLAQSLLTTTTSGKGLWNWTVENVVGRDAICLSWESTVPNQLRAIKAANLDRLATEVSVNPRLAMILQQLCETSAIILLPGIRSLNKIGPAMITNRSVVNRSLETVEQTLGTKLIRRTQGKGLISITPAGHAVLDWWSQFYMRWTPISP